MKDLLRLEEAAMLIISIYILVLLKSPWWVYFVLVIGPDISMTGYLVNDKVGAVAYNLFHHKALAILVVITGLAFGCLPIEIAGVVLFGHSSMDRMFGYGLKFFSGFKQTHLGQIGPPKNKR